MYIILIPYIISAAITIWLGVAAWRRRLIPGAQLFASLSFAEGIWTLGYISQLIAGNLDAKLFWNNVQFIGATVTPLLYLGFALEFDQTFTRPKRISWKHFAPLALGLLIFIWTDTWHGLFRGQITLVTQEPFSFLVYTETPGFALYTIYAYSLIVLTTIILVARYIHASQLFKIQTGILLVGVLIPWTASVITALHLIAIELHELVPITFGLGNLIIAWGLFRYKLFEVIPIAREYLFEHLADCVFVLDHQLVVEDMNPAAQRILGRKPHQVLGSKLTSLLPIQPEWFSDIQKDKIKTLELQIHCGQNQRFYEARVSRLSDPSDHLPVFIITLHDIHERKLLEEKLAQQAQTDSLTGIPNRRHISLLANIEIERAFRCAHDLCIILFDIDHFKSVNDALGHSTGDRALQLLARECLNNLRKHDFLGRYGGEEFLMVLPNTDLHTSVQIAERIRNLVETLPVKIGENGIQITISLGITQLAGRTGLSLEQLIDEADKALYQAKQQGRNQTSCYSPEMVSNDHRSIYE